MGLGLIVVLILTVVMLSSYFYGRYVNFRLQKKYWAVLSKAIKEGVFGYGTPGQIKGRIKLFIRNSFLPTHIRLFRRLPADKQLYWLNKMTPTELKKYLPYASKEAKVKYIMAHRKKVK